MEGVCCGETWQGRSRSEGDWGPRSILEGLIGRDSLVPWFEIIEEGVNCESMDVKERTEVKRYNQKANSGGVLVG